MNNHYKRMYVLSEDEYNRLKLQQKVQTVAAAVEEPRTADDVVQPSPPPTTHYTCPICGKTYKQKRDLRRHVKLVHGIAPPIKAIIPPTPTVETNIIEKKNKKEKKQKQKKRKSLKSNRLEVFDKVRKWMTIRD